MLKYPGMDFIKHRDFTRLVRSTQIIVRWGRLAIRGRLVDLVLSGSDACKDEDRRTLIDRSSVSKSKN